MGDFTPPCTRTWYAYTVGIPQTVAQPQRNEVMCEYAQATLAAIMVGPHGPTRAQKFLANPTVLRLKERVSEAVAGVPLPTLQEWTDWVQGKGEIVETPELSDTLAAVAGYVYDLAEWWDATTE